MIICVCVCAYILDTCLKYVQAPIARLFFTDLYALFGPHAPFGSTQW